MGFGNRCRLSILGIITLSFVATRALAGYNGTQSELSITPGGAGGPFAGILVAPGSSTSAAGRTLAQLKLALTQKVEAGQLTVEQASQIYARYAAILDPYAAGAANTAAPSDPGPDPTAKTIEEASNNPPPAPPATATAAPAPISTTTVAKPPSAPTLASSLNSTGAATLDKLSGILNQTAKKERDPIYSEGGASPSSGSSAPASWNPFGALGSSGSSESGAAGFATGGSVIERRAQAPNRKMASRLGTLSPPPAGRSPASLGFAEGAASGGLFALPKTAFRADLALIQSLYDTGDAYLAEVSPFPSWINWSFGSLLALLLARAAWQWKRRRRRAS